MRTIFRPLGSLELVGDFVFPHVYGLWNQCLGRKGSLVEGRSVGLIDQEIGIEVEAVKPGNGSGNIPHASLGADSREAGIHFDIDSAFLRFTPTVAEAQLL